MLPDNLSYQFSREPQRFGLFAWPAVTFSLGLQGSTIGRFVINHNTAEYISAGGRDSFQLRKNWWNGRWNYDNADELPFAKTIFGFARPAIVFPDDSRYEMRLRRRWSIFNRSQPGDPAHFAAFSLNETVVMTLQNDLPHRIFASEGFMPMAGEINTSLRDIRLICGMLLLFQTSLLRRAATVA